MEKVRKILVHLSKENAAPQCARFVQSITGHFVGSVEDQATVSCSLENNRFILCDQLCDGGVPLKRAPFCPTKYLFHSEADSLPPDTLNCGVDVGVAVLLQSANQRLLLSVAPPAPGSSPMFGFRPLLDAGLRELKEETGLKLSPDEVSSQLLSQWECIRPCCPEDCLRDMTYILLKSSQSHLQLQTCLCPDRAEVSACVWVDASLVKVVVSAVDGEKNSVQIPADLPQTISVTEVSPHGELTETLLPVSVFCNRAPDHSEDIERISTGTKFALELWLKTLEPHAEMG